MLDRLTLAAEVAAALSNGHAVVAVESAWITHGFEYPENRDIAFAAQAAIRERGAVPAIIAICDGRICVGLTDTQVQQLATAANAWRTARPTLSFALTRSGWASTTVSATLIATAAAGIRVLATGGIGGVHGNPHRQSALASESLDVSADLDQLARSPVAVVCAGPKSILDVAATIEALESRGVPVVTIGAQNVPGYWSQDSGITSPVSVPSVLEAGRMASLQLSLGLGGMLICRSIPPSDAIPRDDLIRSIAAAIEAAQTADVRGGAVTPWILARLAEATDGRSINATKAAVVHSARLAAELATLIDV
jgi:pseudouridine-5'-phosphate glycosidase